jgi:hypothetical protein
MSRVIGNLLTNAIRHTPSDGSVQIRGWSRADTVVLSVRDGCSEIPARTSTGSSTWPFVMVGPVPRIPNLPSQVVGPVSGWPSCVD